ncbi:MAG: antirestriction protein [Halioglobus sp.]|nr:antirestriction protein [Halioglobus sp.]
MAEAYTGGYWHFYVLSNGGFYMAPEGDSVFKVSCDNYFTGKLSADALGITACLYTYSHISFSQDEALGRIMADC